MEKPWCTDCDAEGIYDIDCWVCPICGKPLRPIR